MISRISSREMDVLQLIANECTTKEIANKLFISHHTVVSHRKNLMEKLSAKNSVGIVIRAIQQGVLDLKNMEV